MCRSLLLSQILRLTPRYPLSPVLFPSSRLMRSLSEVGPLSMLLGSDRSSEVVSRGPNRLASRTIFPRAVLYSIISSGPSRDEGGSMRRKPTATRGKRLACTRKRRRSLRSVSSRGHYISLSGLPFQTSTDASVVAVAGTIDEGDPGKMGTD